MDNQKSKRSPKLKRPDSAAIRGMLLEGNFGQQSSDEPLAVSDPITITQMVLKLEEIKAYDRNPRQLLNPEYSSIKASIRNQRGLNNPFNITRRPGDELYMVHSGGNTRLMILRELYAETHDEAFNIVNCLFVPWTNEAAVITAHMIENEMRGEMAIIDKAYGIKNLRFQLEQENDGALSERAFVKRVIELGYKLSRRQLSRLNYALELDQIIPEAIREGITYRQLETIRDTERAYLRYCEGKTNEMPMVFKRHMAEHDGETFDFEQVRSAIEYELEGLLGVPSNRISLQIELFMVDDSKKHNTLELLLEPLEEYPDEYPDPRKSMQQQQAVTADKPEFSARLSAALKAGSKSKPSAGGEDTYDLQMLHRQGYRLAVEIAKSVNMGHLVLLRSGGMGFVMEKPDVQPQDLAQWGLWWLLVGLSEQNADQSHVELWKDTELYRLYASDSLQSTSIFQGTGEGGTHVRHFLGDAPNLQSFPFQVLSNSSVLKAQEFKALFKLMGNCRLINAHFTAEQLWPNSK